jgi:4-amino-4-deoxy-L-arabinose transferase-like glycosyltransferase
LFCLQLRLPFVLIARRLRHDRPVTVAPIPALVSSDAARPLPRVALLLLCAAYVLPGVFGRDPWKNADLTAFGQMLAMAEGRTSWWAPSLGGVPTDAAALPHWLGAAFIALTSPWLDPSLAARIPFALLLAFTLVMVWYASFALARTEAAQPLPFAFGGEAPPVDYARAIADAAILALIATLGLLQLGHETTPELAQLAAIATAQWALAVAPFHPARSRVGIVLALPVLACSGAPAMAAMLGVAGVVICARSNYAAVRRFGWWMAGATALAAAAAWALDQWAWRVTPALSPFQVLHVGRQWLWFLWPAWLLALWALWQWRHYLSRRHVAVPLSLLLTGLAANAVMGGSDRALMLGLPGVAVLAAFALPTLRRSTGSAIDWFSVFFFSLLAFAVWVVYIAMQTGVPAKPAANVIKLAPGFKPQFSGLALVVAVAATLAWMWLVRWRTARHRAAIWRSLVLPAGGVVLAWNLTMTLWLPPLDYARSYRAHMALLSRHIPSDVCIAAPGLPRALTAALEYHGRWRVDARAEAANGDCPVWVKAGTIANPPLAPPGWQTVAIERRPTDKDEVTGVFRRP